ncbi:hypothetical protein WJX73_008719 [Symbiochloris irregularis]|uniref:Uncharacterized protein n=1 Tax=Symbiochloris irregularis TaxID=706552 RepID=A0AAW1NSF7_9CHLO
MVLVLSLMTLKEVKPPARVSLDFHWGLITNLIALLGMLQPPDNADHANRGQNAPPRRAPPFAVPAPPGPSPPWEPSSRMIDDKGDAHQHPLHPPACILQATEADVPYLNLNPDSLAIQTPPSERRLESPRGRRARCATLD